MNRQFDDALGRAGTFAGPSPEDIQKKLRSFEVQGQSGVDTPPRSPGEIGAGVHMVHEAIDALGKAIERLNQRLEPVLISRPSEPTNRARPPACSALGNALSEIFFKVAVIREQVEAIEEALAL